MSQTYKVTLKNSINVVVTADDCISYPIQLTEILPPEEMKEKFKDALEKHGFEKESENIYKKEGEVGELITVDLESMEIQASLSMEKEISREVSVSRSSENKRSAKRSAKQALDQRSETEKSKLSEQGTDSLNKEIAETLTESNEARMRELNELIQETYAESIKEKARSYGEVLEINESTNESGEYQLHIRIEQ